MQRDFGDQNRQPGGILTKIKLLMEHNRLGELLVLKGHLTPQQLNYALARQESSDGAQLGRVLLREQLIGRNRLYSTLGQQWTMRCLAGALTFLITFSSVNIKGARAGVRDVPGLMKLASAANAAFTPVESYPALFGSSEKASTNLAPFTKWTGMFDRFERAMSQAQGRRIIADWQSDLQGMQGLPLKAMAEQVNDLINSRDYILDNRNWGQSDYWSTPVEFFTRGGDCEDFAIAKYVSLRALGVPEDHLRVAIVHDMEKDIPHAVLIVYTGTDAYVLDNQVKQMRSIRGVNRYKPIFSINRNAWWLHTAPKATIVASAD